MRFLYALLLAAFVWILPNQVISSQGNTENPDIIGWDAMSTNGKDTLAKYYQEKHMELFGTEVNIFSTVNIKVVKDVQKSFFRDKMSVADLALLDKHWDAKYAEFVEKTKAQSIAYKTALDCQLLRLDLLRSMYYDRLLAFKDTIETTLTISQKEIIHRLWAESIKKLRHKRDQFLDYENNNTLEIDSSRYKYMKYGFQLMEEIPAAKYYNLLGMDNSALSFIDSLPFEKYFSVYNEFEERLTEGLSGDCRAHLAIPFYHYEYSENIEAIHQRRNAIFFIALFFTNSVDVDEISVTKPPLLSIPIDTSKMTDSPYAISEFVDHKMIKEMNLVYAEDMCPPRFAIFEPETNSPDHYVTIAFIHAKSVSEKRQALDEYILSSRHDPYTGFALNNLKGYYYTEREENSHNLRVLESTQAILFLEGEIFQFIYVGDIVPGASITDYFTLLKSPK